MPSYNIALDCLLRHATGAHSGERALSCVAGDNPHEVQHYSFAAVLELSSRVASALHQQGVSAGARILLRLSNDITFPAAFLGAIIGGAIPVPTSPLLTASELEAIRADSGAELVVSESIQEFLREARTPLQRPKTQGDDPAYWLYTSGTEGQAKGVIHAHRSIPAHDLRTQYWQDLHPGDVVFNTSALNWSYALTCGWLDPWRQGISVVLDAGPPDPARLCAIIREQGVSVFMSVPGIYRRLVRYLSGHREDLGRLRVVLSAGEALGHETRQKFFELTGRMIYEGLGMTEHSVYLVQPYDVALVAGSCGQALAPADVAVLSEDLSPVAVGEVGILASRRTAPGLMLHYHQRSHETAEAFRGDWFLSGDLAARDTQGHYFFMGRRDDVVTAGGYRVSPLEVEAILNRHPQVAESAVAARSLSEEKTIIVAYVVAAPELDTSTLISFAREHLARYKVPREIVFCESLPKTRNGKLQRRQLA